MARHEGEGAVGRGIVVGGRAASPCDVVLALDVGDRPRPPHGHLGHIGQAHRHRHGLQVDGAVDDGRDGAVANVAEDDVEPGEPHGGVQPDTRDHVRAAVDRLGDGHPVDRQQIAGAEVRIDLLWANLARGQNELHRPPEA